MSYFSDPAAVKNYAEGPARKVPGFAAMQTMADILLAETMPGDGRLLVLGAGGGLELKVFAERHAGWSFCGVDPSGPMLDLARQTLGPLSSRVSFHQGYIDDAPVGPFDGATSILTLHFLDREQRRDTLSHIYRRLKPGARFIVVHYSYPQEEAEPLKWLNRCAAHAVAAGEDADAARKGAATIAERLPVLAPDEDEAMLREAGFVDVELFYAAFAFRGWIARRPG